MSRQDIIIWTFLSINKDYKMGLIIAIITGFVITIFLAMITTRVIDVVSKLGFYLGPANKLSIFRLIRYRNQTQNSLEKRYINTLIMLYSLTTFLLFSHALIAILTLILNELVPIKATHR